MDAIKEGMLASAKAAEAAARIGERLFCQNTPNVMNFNSQICTSREQSERLLALGLKKETADMHWAYHSVTATRYIVAHPCDGVGECIPAWSLGRLIKDLMPQSIGRLELAVGGDYAGYYVDEFYGIDWKYCSETSDMFDNIISTVEWLIKVGYFNKEYLEDKK